MIAALVLALDIVFVRPQLPPEVRWQAVAAEVVKLAEHDSSRVAVVDGELRALAAFTTKPETIRYAIMTRDARSGEVVETKDRLVVIATYDRRVTVGGIVLPALALDTSPSGALVAGIVTKDGVTLHPRMALSELVPLLPKPQPTIEQPQDVAMKLFVDALRRLHDGDDEGVETMLDEVIALDSTLADAWYERGMLAAAREDHAAAKRDLTKYLQLAPRGKHATDAREFLRTID